MADLKPKDFIALVVIIAIVVFKMTGHNGTFDIPVGIIIGYYFGHRSSKVDTGV